jgi:MFS transporter, SP family, sugar:H+ symporter
MVSTPFIGKFIGALTAGYTSKRWGRKPSLYILAVLSVLGVLLQTTARTAAQFTVGRIVNFGSMGFTINVVPTYMSECIPADLRGAFSTTLQLWINFGTLIATLVNYGCQNLEGNKAWEIPTGKEPTFSVVLIGRSSIRFACFLYLRTSFDS